MQAPSVGKTLDISRVDWRRLTAADRSARDCVVHAQRVLQAMSNPEIERLVGWVMEWAHEQANDVQRAPGLEDVLYTKAEVRAARVLVAAVVSDVPGVIEEGKALRLVHPFPSSIERAHQRHVKLRAAVGRTKSGKLSRKTRQALDALPAIMARLGGKASTGTVRMAFERQDIYIAHSTVKALLKNWREREK